MNTPGSPVMPFRSIIQAETIPLWEDGSGSMVGGRAGGKGVDVAMVDNICGSATLAADSTFGA